MGGKVGREMGRAKENKEMWLWFGCRSTVTSKIATLPAKKESLPVSPELPPELGPTRPSCYDRGVCSASRSGAFGG